MDANRILWKEVLEEELRHIRARRGSGDETPPLVGLGISGGGIRSATFGLGVLETLKHLGVLKAVDYLSTVSGGGYIGSWLTAGVKRDPEWLERDTDWKPAIAHLRRYSNYLSPKVGFFSADTWSMFSIWARNTLLIQTTVILAVACVLLLPRLLFELFRFWPAAGHWRWASVVLFLLGIVGIAGNQMRLTGGTNVWLQARGWPLGLAASAVLSGLAYAYGTAVGFEPFRPGAVNYQGAFPVALLLALAAFVLQPVAVRIVNATWRGKHPPEEVNYTQNWVQVAVVIPMSAAAFLVAAILWNDAVGAGVAPGLHSLNTYGEILSQGWRYWPFPLSVVFVSFWLLSLWGVKDRRSAQGLGTAILAPVVGAAAMHALLSGVLLLLRGWAAVPAANAAVAFVFGPPLVAVAFVLSIVVLLGMLGRQSTDSVREWWSRLGAWLGIYSTAWMLVAVSAVYGPQIVEWLASGTYLPSLTAGGWIGTVAGGLLAGNSPSTQGSPSRSAVTQAKELLARVAPLVFIAGLLLIVSWVIDYVIRTNANGISWRTLTNAQAVDWSLLSTSSLLLAGVAAVMTLFASRVDINQFSLNEFYRNRLVRCYLGATRERNPQNFTGFDEADDICLAELEGAPEAPFHGPLHIVNCALNLGGSSDLALHTRHSASFTFSPLFCGSRYAPGMKAGEKTELEAAEADIDEQPVGYVKTSAYSGHFGVPTLGQAVSISGAAASPNMGYHTSPVTAFMLTLFNVRLGWWFPNPSKIGSGVASPNFSLPYLLSELFGGANDQSHFLMLSDGGHFENLAGYELIQRRCRVIILSDAECDPSLTFAGLGTLIRMAEVDFDVKISIDVDAIRYSDDSAWSRARYAIGTIDYGPGVEPGTLIYIKAAIPKGEADTALLQYKSSHPAFPHESTSNQFYTEDQFESYRHLGQEAAMDAIGAATSTNQKDGAANERAEKVRALLRVHMP
jgi:hypothetical protein